MADVKVNELTAVSTVESVDSIVMVDRTTNEGPIIPASTFANLQGVVRVACNSGNEGSSMGDFTVNNDSRITSDMVLVHYEMSNPAAMGSNWTVNTVANGLTVSGTISGSTTLILYLAKQRT